MSEHVDNNPPLSSKPISFAPPEEGLDSAAAPGQAVVSSLGAKSSPDVSPGHVRETLFSITQEAQRIELALIESEGQVDLELDTRYSVNNIALEKKVDGYFSIINHISYWAEGLKNHAAMLLNVANTGERFVKGLKGNAKEAMKQLGVVELCGKTVRFTLTPSKPSVAIYDPTLVPGEYFREKVILEPDLTKIYEQLKLGIDVPGAKLIQGQSFGMKAPKKEKK